MHDAQDNIIYVGKAIILKNRVRSYFRESTNKSVKIRQMVEHIAWFEYVVTGSELEALVLENNLIKEHNPKYNTLLKDDKTYPYIKVTTNEDYPRIFSTRKVLKDNARYYGPFTSAASVNETIELLRKLYNIRNCNKKISGNRPILKSGSAHGREDWEEDGINPGGTCLYYHLGRCRAPCIGAVSREEYRDEMQGAVDFLNGNYRPLLKELNDKMQAASEEMDYEKAMEYRDLLESVRQVAQKQRITDSHSDDRDVVAMARDEESVIIQIFYIRLVFNFRNRSLYINHR